MPETSHQTSQRKTIGEWLASPFVWRIPVYQRHYAWNAELESGPVHLFWETVKEHVEKRLAGIKPDPHYLGAVLVDKQKDKSLELDEAKHFDVVDGQQRLTTIQIAILALTVAAKEPSLKEKIKKDLEKYVFSNKEASPPKTRLRPTNFDETQFNTVMFRAYGSYSSGRSDMIKENADKSKVYETFNFFIDACERLIKHYSPKHEHATVIDAVKETLINGFDLVLIVLEEHDNAQRVFESLNNYAEPLTTFDLIRNNVFYRAAEDNTSPGLDEKLFKGEAWQFLESDYWGQRSDQNKKKGESPTHIEACIARALVAFLRKEILFKRNEIFRAYKEGFCYEKCDKFSSIDEEVAALVRYAKIYQYLDSGEGKSPIEGCDFGVFRPYGLWGKRDYYPLMFCIVEGKQKTDEKQKMIKLLESYVIRREICGLSAKAYNKQAAAICKEFGNDLTYEGLRHFLSRAQKDTGIFPDHDRVRKGCLEVNFYRKNIDQSLLKRYVFERIEKHLAQDDAERGKINSKKLTIDHILPQGWEKDKGWKEVLGTEVNEMMINHSIDTIGNLTLMSSERNNQKSNNPWNDVKGLLEDSQMQLNRELAKEETWNVEKITERGKSLAKIICEIWPYDIK